MYKYIIIEVLVYMVHTAAYACMRLFNIMYGASDACNIYLQMHTPTGPNRIDTTAVKPKPWHCSNHTSKP
jgi:hypothetical protein